MRHRRQERAVASARAVRLRIVGLAVALTTLCGPALADKEPAIDPQARSLLDQVIATYQGLAAYTDEGRFLASFTLDGKPAENTIPLRWSIVRSSPQNESTRLRLETASVTVIADGERFLELIHPTKRYRVTTPPPAKLTPELLTEGPAGAELLGSPSAGAAWIILSLLLADDPASRLLETGTTLSLWNDTGSDEPVTGLVLTTPSGLVTRLRIDPATSLITRIELAPAVAPAEPDLVPGHPLTGSTLVWESGTISTDPAPPETFQWNADAEGFLELKQR